jgi:electron transfer flavoprotein beta subunit
MGMQIGVCIKPVADLGERPPPTLESLQSTLGKASFVLGSSDAAALSLACRVATENGGEVAVVTMAPESAEATIRHCLALGGTRGVRLWDQGFAGSDTWATATVLAAYLTSLPMDLVLCGDFSSDSRTGLVPYFLAGLLGWPCISPVIDLRLDASGKRLTALRQLPRGDRLEVKLSLPAVLAVAQLAAGPGYPTLRGRLRAAAAVIPVLGRSDLGLTASQVGASNARLVIGGLDLYRWVPENSAAVTSRLPPAQRLQRLTSRVSRVGKGALIQEATETAVAKLVQFLQEKGLLRGSS